MPGSAVSTILLPYVYRFFNCISEVLTEPIVTLSAVKACRVIAFHKEGKTVDGLLDIVCFDAGRRRELEKWLNAPQEDPAPVTTRQGKIVELTWADVANRLDDEAYSNRDTKQVAELACEKEQAKMLIPVKHPAQKAVAK